MLVNGNPLLRFDGYFVATDALEFATWPSAAATADWQVWAAHTARD